MAKQKLQPVEGWKLNPELKKLEKGFRDRTRIAKMLKQGIAVKTGELAQMTQALFGVEKQQEMMTKMVPPEQQEVEGTPLPDPNLNINY